MKNNFPPRTGVVPAKWFPASAERAVDITELCQRIAERLPLVIIVRDEAPVSHGDKGEDVAVLKARIAQLEARIARRAALDEATMGSVGLPVLEDAAEPRIPLLSASLAGRFGEPRARRSLWERFVSIFGGLGS
jgi:hypothetical protein